MIPGLNYADKDASMFADWLRSKAGGSVPNYRIKLMVNGEATIAGVYNALDWLKENASTGDTLYIYFSGHGDVETNDSTSQGYLLAWDSPPNNYRNNAISVADLNNISNDLTTINKANIILITDACHSGKMAGDFYKGKQLTASNLRLVLNNQVRLASCNVDEEAAEGPNWGGGRGVFSYYLLMGLSGMADVEKDGVIKLRDLTSFIDSVFSSDKNLKADKHQQHPVTDGSPFFPLATVDPATLNITKIASLNARNPTSLSSAGLQSLKSLVRQPIDYFFSLLKTPRLDSTLNFKSYINLEIDSVPFKMVNDYTVFIDTLKQTYDSLASLDEAGRRIVYSSWRDKTKDPLEIEKIQILNDSIWRTINEHQGPENKILPKIKNIELDSLKLLRNQLQNNKYIIARFIEKFVQTTHEKSQDMINAYLKGDLTELEKRQYYYSGNRNYRNFLPIMDVAIHLVVGSKYLSEILTINRSYIAGLVDRLEMATSKQTDSLLNGALKHELLAVKLEPYAAYIHNELGNLYLRKKQYDSAGYHFNYASVLSPTWAIPWSNKIRLNLALNKIDKAKEAIQVADSLQPNLAYVNVNAGLVMEKDSNWLAAESYYLNAIAQNNVHYLPYERLGYIYTSMLDYSKADSFLYEAKKRKDDFSVNENAFRFGIELGGEDQGAPLDRLRTGCSSSLDTTVTEWNTYYLLLNALKELDFPSKNIEDGENMAIDVLAKSTDIPLLYHYLGRKNYDEKDWRQAEINLKQSILDYKPAPAIRYLIKANLVSALKESRIKTWDADKISDDSLLVKEKEFNAFTDTSCLLTSLMNFSYDELDDHYLLAKLYEQKGFWDEAITQYKTIGIIENQRQIAQAMFKDYFVPKYTGPAGREKNFQDYKKYLADNNLDDRTVTGKYKIALRMGGSIKAARIYEQLGDYEQAEKVLLNQVELNRNAGYLRQAQRDEGNYGPGDAEPFNYYFLHINEDLEAVTYNFYERMLQLFPRDAGWYEKAGIFLYNRLALTYYQVALPERNDFYKYSLNYAYPFKGSVEHPNQWMDDEDSTLHTIKNKFNLPATGEEINIDMLAYDPVKKSLEYLQQAIKLSGDDYPGRTLTESIADLNAWIGNKDTAINIYSKLVKLYPENATLRNKLINYLISNKLYPPAYIQLDILYQRGQIRREQLLQLIAFKIQSKQQRASAELLKNVTPVSESEKNELTKLNALQNILMGHPEKALQIMNLVTAFYPVEDKSDTEARNFKNKEKISLLYSRARLYAVIHQDKNAFKMLKQALDSGFCFRYVLQSDETWKKLRKTKKWQQLVNSYTIEDPNDSIEPYAEKINYEPVLYRIPMFSFILQ